MNEDALQWLIERGHDVVYQSRMDGVSGHFLTLLYLPSPFMSFHKEHLIEGASLADCLVIAREWIETNCEGAVTCPPT